MLGTDGLLVNRVYDQPIRRIAVFGERSSGTNVSEFVLQNALGLESSTAMGWKHGFVQGAGIARDTLVVVSVRNPYDWVSSMYDKPWHCTDAMRGLGFSGFIRAPWDSALNKPKAYFGLPPQEYSGVPLIQDRDLLTGLRFENLIRMRTSKLRHWTGLANDLCNLVVWRFEAFKAAPEAILNKVSDTFDTELRRVEWPDQPMGRMQPRMRQGKIDTIGPHDLEFINTQLDPDLERALGYSLCEHTS